MGIKKVNFVSIDVETGGIDPTVNPLLEIAIVPYIDGKTDKIFNEKIIVNDKANISEIAKKINGYEEKTHRLTAKSEIEVLDKLKEYMLQLKEINNGKLLMPLGRNVDFDVNFLKYFFKKQKEIYDNYFDYHKYDLTAVGYFLYEQGYIDILPSSGDKICDALNIERESVPHLGINGALKNIEVYKECHKLLLKTNKRR